MRDLTSLRGRIGVDAIQQAPIRPAKVKITLVSQTTWKPKGGRVANCRDRNCPTRINKNKLIQRLDEIRIQRKVVVVRDESDRNGVRLVVELKRDNWRQGDSDLSSRNILTCKVNYHFNMVAINKRLDLSWLTYKPCLEAILVTSRSLTRHTQYDLANDQNVYTS